MTGPGRTLTVVGRIEEVDFIDSFSSVPHERPRNIPKGAVLVVSGWATFEEEPAAATSVYLHVDGGTPFEALYGLERSDIAEVFADDRFAAGGFRGVLSTDTLAPGEHTIGVSVRDGDGNLWGLDGHETFSIEAALDRIVLETPADPRETHIVVEALSVDGVPAEEPLQAGPFGIVGVAGWAVDLPGGTTGTAIFGVIDGTVVKGTYGIPRPDVAETLESSAYLAAGFALHVPLDGIASGAHLLRLRLVAADGATVYDGPSTPVSVVAFDTGAASIVPRAEATTVSIDETAVFEKSGHVRSPSGPIRLKRGDQLFLRGWAIDDANEAPARAVHVCIDDLPSTLAIYGLDRPDVADAHERPDLLATGFTALVSTSAMPPGAHELALRVVDAEGLRYYDTDFRIAFTLEEPA